uniref:Uncharacterized protein n=1 Tax=Oryza barthii TaxID=65489 RepID=A0A0D3FC19_9ORYZ
MAMVVYYAASLDAERQTTHTTLGHEDESGFRSLPPNHHSLLFPSPARRSARAAAAATWARSPAGLLLRRRGCNGALARSDPSGAE